MSQHMPVSGFYWIGGDEMDALMIGITQFETNATDSIVDNNVY